MSKKKENKSLKYPTNSWNPDSGKSRHRASGNDQLDPDYNSNQGKFLPLEQEFEVADDFGITEESDLKFDFEALKKLSS